MSISPSTNANDGFGSESNIFSPSKDQITQTYLDIKQNTQNLPEEKPVLENDELICGFYEESGRRPRMEDASVVQLDFRSPLKEAFIGIYDGHGGSKCSLYVSKTLHHILSHRINQFLQYKKKAEEPHLTQYEIFKRVLCCDNVKSVDEDEAKKSEKKFSDEEFKENPANDHGLGEYGLSSDTDDDSDDKNDQLEENKIKTKPNDNMIDFSKLDYSKVVQYLLRESFLETDHEILKKKIPHGTTASAMYFYHEEGKDKLQCAIANVGDTRVVLYRNGEAKILTKDHRTNDEGEQEKIKRAGGFIIRDRVNGILAVTRAFGDSFLKPYITADPDVQHVEIDKNTDEFMVMACDGVWDYVTTEKAMEIIKAEKDVKIASKKLVEYAYSEGMSSDNISAVVIRFK